MTMKGDSQGRLTRRSIIKGAAAGTAAVAGMGWVGSSAQIGPSVPPVRCGAAPDINLVNGRFLTMNPANPVVSDVAIRNGRIAQVGATTAPGSCLRTVDLKGATVIPGLVDSHLHHIRQCLSPGHEVRIIETAQSIPELLQMISARIAQLQVPAGEFITCVGGWNINALAEARLPSIAELDSAAPLNPVYLSTTGTGGGVTNTAGKAFFVEKGVIVSTSGTGVATLDTAQGFLALRNAQVAGDRRLSNRTKGTQEVNDFTVGRGLTTVHDVGGNGGFTGVPELFVDLSPYEQAMNLWRAGNLYPRHRLWMWSDLDDTTAIARMQLTMRRLGDDYFRIAGVGERTNLTTTSPGFVDNCLAAARNGWAVHQHSSTAAEIEFHITAFEQANAMLQASTSPSSIRPLRWQPTHVNEISDSQLNRLVALGTSVSVQGTSFTSGTATTGSSGTPFRSILDKLRPQGFFVGGGSDGTNVGAFNPWLMMSFMTTGKNNAGNKINPLRNGAPQEITRMEALWMYTLGSSWFTSDDDRSGSIDPGKYADLAVLSDDPLTVSDERFKRLSSTMTLVGGKVVYGSLG